MLQLANVDLKKLIIHRVGNKSMEMGYKLSDQAIDMPAHPDLATILNGYFLSSFANVPLNHFTHASSLDMNEVYTLAAKIFDTPSFFTKTSK